MTAVQSEILTIVNRGPHESLQVTREEIGGSSFAVIQVWSGGPGELQPCEGRKVTLRANELALVAGALLGAAGEFESFLPQMNAPAPSPKHSRQALRRSVAQSIENEIDDDEIVIDDDIDR